MFIAGTQMHMVTFGIIVFELVMFLFQVVYFLQRPKDRGRFLYLILLILLLMYNTASGLFPDVKIPISILLQEIIAYFVGFAVSIYVVYYFYKVFEFGHLKYFATYGLVLCLVVPFLFCFVLPLLITGNLELSRRLSVVIPFIYGICFIVWTTRAIYEKFKDSKHRTGEVNQALYQHAIAVYIAMLCWAALPVIVFFGDFQVLEQSVTNAGFLMMTLIYVRSSIQQARNEYDKLISSEQSLVNLQQDIQEEIRKRTRRLEELYEQRTNTFINLAHETRTPLTLINNYLQEYIEKYGTNPEMQIIKANIQTLTSDIVNFFDSERFNRGFEIYDHEQITNFSFILNLKITLFKNLATKKRIVIREYVGQNVYVKAHPGAIERIVNNLIDNSIKFTQPNGEIEISLETEGDNAIFSVSDNGPVIQNNYQSKIFDPFFRVTNNFVKNYEGAGLGLSIVNKVVEDLRGKIVLGSREGEGTTIKVILHKLELKGGAHESFQVQENSNDTDATKNVSDVIIDSARPFVLIVEDNLAMLSYLSDKLGGRYNVYATRSGSEALLKLKSIEKLDLILSDIVMSDGNGFELLEAISKIPEWMHVPAIILSGKTTAADKLKGLRLGAIDYIEKPFVIEYLYSKIDSVLSNIEKQHLALVKRASSKIHVKYEVTGTEKGSLENIFQRNCGRYLLTARETEIVSLLTIGHPYKIIADKLSISSKTVAAHLSNIFEKLQVNNKVELINKLNGRI